MVDTRRIPEEDWDAHEDRLYSLCIFEKKSLGQVIEYAVDEYGFGPRVYLVSCVSDLDVGGCFSRVDYRIF